MRGAQGGVAGASVAGRSANAYFNSIGRKTAPMPRKCEGITAMAANVTPAPVPFGAITVYRLVQSVDRSFHAVSAWNARRVTRKVLNTLSNRELDDIGLCRGDIEMIGI